MRCSRGGFRSRDHRRSARTPICKAEGAHLAYDRLMAAKKSERVRAKKGDTFRPGEPVPRSGIYVVAHNGHGKKDHEVTCVFGRKFPPCAECKANVIFILRYAAPHVKRHPLFPSL